MGITGKFGGSKHRSGAQDSTMPLRAEAMIVPPQTARHATEAFAVLYASGARAPRITVTEGAPRVFTVRADGAPVAVVAAQEPPRPGQIRVIERNPDGSVPPLPGDGIYLN